MAEGTATTYIRKIVSVAEPYLPQVPKPKKKLSLQMRFVWSGLALLIYMIMSQTPLFGATTPEFDFLEFARVIFASQQGTLVELGIGPIVTSGLLMQLLRGSDILKFDFKKPNERAVFQTATKLVTYIVIVGESVVYGIAVYGPNITDPTILYILVGQLMAASIIIMFLDELIQKGWGIGSGVFFSVLAPVEGTVLQQRLFCVCMWWQFPQPFVVCTSLGTTFSSTVTFPPAFSSFTLADSVQRLTFIEYATDVEPPPRSLSYPAAVRSIILRPASSLPILA